MYAALKNGSMKLIELMEGVSLEEVKDKTEASFEVCLGG